jgi:hypothetical protein
MQNPVLGLHVELPETWHSPVKQVTPAQKLTGGGGGGGGGGAGGDAPAEIGHVIITR